MTAAGGSPPCPSSPSSPPARPSGSGRPGSRRDGAETRADLRIATVAVDTSALSSLEASPVAAWVRSSLTSRIGRALEGRIAPGDPGGATLDVRVDAVVLGPVGPDGGALDRISGEATLSGGGAEDKPAGVAVTLPYAASRGDRSRRSQRSSGGSTRSRGVRGQLPGKLGFDAEGGERPLRGRRLWSGGGALALGGGGDQAVATADDVEPGAGRRRRLAAQDRTPEVHRPRFAGQPPFHLLGVAKQQFHVAVTDGIEHLPLLRPVRDPCFLASQVRPPAPNVPQR